MAQMVQVLENKKDYMDLLLLADEQEDMLLQYLDRGEMFILTDNQSVVAECVVTDEGDGICELKNLAVDGVHHRKGYGRALVNLIINHYKEKFDEMIVCTGDSPITVPFYESCGFVVSRRLVNFILDSYDHPIYENGIRIFDAVYLKMKLQQG